MHSNKKPITKVQPDQANINNNLNNNANQTTNINRALYLMRAVEGTPKDRFLLTK